MELFKLIMKILKNSSYKDIKELGMITAVDFIIIKLGKHKMNFEETSLGNIQQYNNTIS